MRDVSMQKAALLARGRMSELTALQFVVSGLGWIPGNCCD